MFSFFRKKATATEIGTTLLQFLIGSERSDEDVLKNLPANAEVDQQTVINEIMGLRAFVIDFATAMTLGNTREKNAVLDAYWAHLEEMAKQSEVGAIVLRNLKSRSCVYTEAVKTPHHNGPAWTVGKAFAEFCGSKMDITLIMIGSTEFAVTLKSVSKFIKSFQIIV